MNKLASGRKLLKYFPTKIELELSFGETDFTSLNPISFNNINNLLDDHHDFGEFGNNNF